MPVTRLALVVLVVVAACAGANRETLTVSAASSLADVMTELAEAFEAEHPGVEVVVNLGSTSSLRNQILQGAPVDVFASADLENMTRVVEAGMALYEPRVFASNRLQIAVAAGNPREVSGLADLGRDDLAVGLCAEPVPCGRLAREALDAAGVTPSLASAEPNARAVLSKVAAGELDAGIVYVTDVHAEDRVEAVEIPEDHNRANQYHIAVTTETRDAALATDFADFVLSARGAQVLARHRFETP